MALRGKFETAQLKKNIQTQLDRLLMQMSDLEKFKDEFDSKEEWLEEKKETEQQLKEFKDFLDRTLKGDMTLVDEFSSIQLAIQATVANAFKTPDIIRAFAKKEPDQLRQKLSQLTRDMKTKKLNKKIYQQQSYEICLALQKLGTKLNNNELNIIKEYESKGMSAASKNLQSNDILNNAKTQINKISK